MDVQQIRILQDIHDVDIRVFRWCVEVLRSNAVTRFTRAVSRTADGWLYVLGPLLYLVYNGRGAAGLIEVTAAAFALERPLYLFLKKHFKRRRPPEAIEGFTSIIVASDQFSFPSGHTSGAFLMITVVAGVLGAPFAVMYVWAMAVGLSRLLLGVHFPSDIVAGALMGTTLAHLALVVV